MRVTSPRPPVLVTLVVAGAIVISTCRENAGPTGPGPSRSPILASTGANPPVVLVGAGNIARCDRTNDDATAALLDSIPGTVFALGDNSYPGGTATTYTNCYNPTWGRQKARTYPVLGNHDYDSSTTAAGYFGYFGAAAGDPTKGYYSFDLGAWHIVVLNSNNSFVSTAVGSPQETWLKADLAATTKQCILALWHHPRFYSTTSASFSPNTSVKPFWDDLAARHATLIINAHMRDYERFAPQTSAGVADPVNGIREIIIGTGGEGLDAANTLIIPNSEARISGVYGVLKLALYDGSYSWQFVPIAGQTASDAGSSACYGGGPVPPTVNAGPDLTAAAGDTVHVAATFTDPGPNDAPWTYTVTWGDGTSSTGTTTTSSTPITASHVYTAPGLDSVRVTVTNAFGLSGSDSLAVQASSPGAAILVGAGDIADSTTNGDSLTANLLDGITGTVFTLGDNAYPMGTSSDYTKWYAPTWGRHLSRTRPVPGNHEYNAGAAPGYYGYFGAAAGDPTKGYYSYNLGDWHIIALNGELDVSPTSAQVQWLRNDLALYSKFCTLAYWHEPRFVSGINTTSNPKYQTLWDTLYAYGADVVINGHKHSYERFAPQSPAAVLDTLYGIREFVVGTGGTGIDGGNPAPVANSQVRNTVTWGVLKMTLNSGSYTWQFIPVAGQTFADAGSGLCHNAPSAINHPPTAVSGGPYSGVEGTAVSFNGGGSSDPDGDALTYAWSFGDGTTGTGPAPSHTYADNGAYTVALTVTDARGAASSAVTTTATIANVAPVVTLPANQTATAASPYSLTATFSDPGVNDSPWGYSIDWGDGTAPTAGTVTSQTAAVTASHTYAVAGTDTVRVTVTDKDGGAGVAKTSVAVAAANRPPSAAPGGPYTGIEGAAVLFNGAGSSDPDGDPITYAWSFGDGTTGTGATPSHAYVDNGAYTVSLTVTDSKGAASAPVTTTATIANATPLVTMPANQVATAGTAYTLNATFSDAGVNDSPWGYSIDWGDGATPTTGSATSQATAITASHTYTASGTDTVRVTVTDKDGGAGSAKTPVAVAAVNHPPTASAGGPYTGNEGAAVAFNGGASSDPDGDALTYAWGFGDGSTGTGVRPSHAYADNGSYTVTLTVTDTHGAVSTAASTTATISNLPPTVSAPASLAATAGSAATLSTTFSDPGVNDAPWTYSISWGDGSAATTGSTTSQGGGISAAHTYTAPGTNTATVTVTDKDGGAGSAQTAVTVAAPVSSVTLVGAGNIARCDRTNDEATAAVLDGIPGTVFAVGDAAYPNGTPTNYANCYNVSWGRHLARTYPALGNHDYDSSATAAGYFGYFGAAAGDPAKGYYSYDLGAWHIIVLNSNNSFVSTAVGSPQETWLKADLAATTKQCVLAMWHMPRFYSTTSTSFFPTASVKPFWDDLYAARAELIINGHMRDYERFAPQTSAGVADPVNGIREIIVGTGGEGLDGPNTLITANSEVQISGVYGVLKLTLSDGSYSWQFIPVAGQTATDSGTGSCH
jgi:PKD repeat protein